MGQTVRKNETLNTLQKEGNSRQQNTKPKLIWVAGAPSSGKTTLALRIAAELNWAQKKTVIFDDDQIKWAGSREAISIMLGVSGGEYMILVTPLPKLLPWKPDLIISCKCPLEVLIERDKRKIINKVGAENIEERYRSWWGQYKIGGDLNLDTYDRGGEVKENVERCWLQVKEKMEELFGDFVWRRYAHGESAWSGAEFSRQFTK